MAKRFRSLPALTLFTAVAATCAFGGSKALAETCLATTTIVTMDGAKAAPAPTPVPTPAEAGATADALDPNASAPTQATTASPAAPAQAAGSINTQDINLEKSFMQDGDSERAQYSTRDGDPISKELFISATVDTASGDATLIIRDLRTGLSANAAGAFGNDGVIATSLSGVIGGLQKLITVTCQK